MIDEMLYWLFSSIAQAYGAIVGFVGLLVVYRLDNLSRLRDSIRERLLSFRYRTAVFKLPDEIYQCSAEEMGGKFREIDRKGASKIQEMKTKEPNTYAHLCSEFDKIDNSALLGNRIRSQFKSFIYFHIPLIVGSILVIFFVPSISGIGRDFDLKVTVFVVLAGALGVSVFQTWRFFKTLIQ